MIARALLAACLLTLLAGCARAPVGGAAEILRPHDTLYRPEGPGPFPAVVLLHGCLGVHSKDRRWAAAFREQGYVALVVDSLTGRGLGTREARQDVCRGFTFWGSTRASDVAASVAYLRSLPFVDGDRIGVVGWSHGAWAALDFLSGVSAEAARGIRAVVSFYPYCGIASRARWWGWSVDVPLLMVLAAEDRFTPPADCQSLARAQARDGRPVEVEVYTEVGHSFDWRDSEQTAAAQERVRRFLQAHLR